MENGLTPEFVTEKLSLFSDSDIVAIKAGHLRAIGIETENGDHQPTEVTVGELRKALGIETEETPSLPAKEDEENDEDSTEPI